MIYYIASSKGNTSLRISVEGEMMGEEEVPLVITKEIVESDAD